LLEGDGGLKFLEADRQFPAYKLPKNPGDVYGKQVDPLMSMRPGSVVFNVNKYQAANRLLSEPFDRIVRKLPAHVRPQQGELPAGPLANPSEPVWFEMQHRLEAILRKQGRRAERRRKRKIRSKLFRGRLPKQAKEGKDLREYLDRGLAEQAGGLQDTPGEMAGEFLGKVHEKYLQHWEDREVPRWQVAGVGSHTAGRGNIGEASTPRVVRPIYMPPPGGSMVRS